MSFVERGTKPPISAKKPRLTRTVVLAIVAVALIAGVAAFAAFTQYFPSVPTTTAPNLVSNCGAALTTPLIATPNTVVAGSAFAIVYSCPAGAPAITVTNAAVTAIPTFAPAPGVGGMPTTFSLIAPGATCTPTAGATIAQSTSVSIGTGSYNYCATGTTAPVTGVVSFTVSWAFP